MKHQLIPFQQTNSLNAIVSNYLQNQSDLFPTYPTLDLLTEKAKVKSAHFSDNNRKSLVASLKKQYHGFSLSEKQRQNLDSLQKSNTLTITTGHQLCLASGPAYFIYKILSVIRLADELNKTDNSHQFVPIYWAASEDHDFEEVNHFYFKGEKIEWDIDSKQQAVGRLKLDGIDQVWDELEKLVNDFSKKEKNWVTSLRKIYREGDTLAQATRKLIQHLFSEYGVLMLDADDSVLKSSFRDYVAADLWEQQTYKTLVSTEKKWNEQGFSLPINPRETNFFFFDSDGKRQRINRNSKGELTLADNPNKVVDTELKQALENQPERFSPNVFMRPLYQEHILPNIAYVGGGAEVAYWLPLQNVFEQFNLPFPCVIHRHGALVLSKTASKISHTIPFASYLKKDKLSLVKERVSENSEVKQALEKIEALRTDIHRQETDLLSVLSSINPALEKSWIGHSKKIKRQLDVLSAKTIKQASIKESHFQNQLEVLFNEVYPQGTFQERKTNFFELAISHHLDLSEILTLLSPLAQGIELLTSENNLNE